MGGQSPSPLKGQGVAPSPRWGEGEGRIFLSRPDDAENIASNTRVEISHIGDICLQNLPREDRGEGEGRMLIRDPRQGTTSVVPKKAPEKTRLQPLGEALRA